MTDSDIRTYRIDDDDIELLSDALSQYDGPFKGDAEHLRLDLAKQQKSNHQGYRVALATGSTDLYPNASGVSLDEHGHLKVYAGRHTLALYPDGRWNDVHAVEAEIEAEGVTGDESAPDPAQQH
jgi:hypothetical protein